MRAVLINTGFLSANLIFYVSVTKLQQYEEDFKHEREDRIRAIEERLRIENEYKAYKEENRKVRCMGEHNSGLVCYIEYDISIH